MYDHVARTQDRKALWRSDAEGLRLWRLIVGGLPGLLALVLMPNHLHLLHSLDVRIALAQILAGYTRSTGRPRMERLPPATWVADPQKRRRQVRYVHLNPCRARLCLDPLSWPFSTHRDATGLVVTRWCPSAEMWRGSIAMSLAIRTSR